MNSVMVLIQTGLLGIAALNLLFAVWLLYRQLRMENMIRAIVDKSTLVGRAESKSPRTPQTAPIAPRRTNLLH